jgi:hypothetical protein
MKRAFSLSFKLFKYLFLTYSIFYWILIIIDDWIFIEKYWSENWLQYILGWSLWWIVIGVFLSLYYWGISAFLIIIYHKLIKSKKENKATNIN